MLNRYSSHVMKNTKLDIIYETQNYFAINKPASLLVYPPSKEVAKTEESVASLIGDKIDFPESGERNGIVHRLDRETSGVLLVAKNPLSQEKLKKLFLDRTIQKKYLALVEGSLEPQRGEIVIPLGRSSKDRLRVIPQAQGKESVTAYRVLKYFPQSDLSLVEADLKTGRTHQIRVHFSAIGHSVVGDQKYSRKRTELARQFLHAQAVIFNDPFEGGKVEIVAPLPPELEDYLQKVGF